MKRPIMTWLLTVLAAMAIAVGPAWCLTNLTPNPSMEVDENGDGVADTWNPNTHTSEGAEGSFAIDTEIKHSGNASQRIEHTSDNRAWVRISQMEIGAKPDAVYRVEAWVRGSGHYTIILFQFLKDQEKEYLSESIGSSDATEEWQHVSKVMTTAPDVAYFKLSLVSDGMGTVWFDDASLVLIAERPNLRVPKIEAAPGIDGSLDEAAWEEAAVADDFMILGGDGEPAPVATRAKVCFDEEALYVGFECEEPNVAGMVRAATEDGAAVWTDDCVEVFLDLEHDRVGYLHLGVSATGAKWHDRRLGARWYTDWYSTGAGEVAVPEWVAAAQVGPAGAGWTAELKLPLSEVGGALKLGTIWGANFCRTRRGGGEEENFTWSYTSGDRYAVPDRFGILAFATRPPRPPAEVQRAADYQPPRPTVIPQPQSLAWKGEPFRPNRQTKIVALADSDMIAAQMLQGDLAGRFRLRLPIEVGAAGADNTVSIGAPTEADATLKPEGYRLVVGPQRVEILGADVRGAFYGTQTLRQMLTEDAKGPLLYGCAVTDWPDNAWRGWHLSSPSQEDLPVYRRFIDMMALLKYNTLCLEVDSRLQYESHPKVGREGSPTKDELRELVAYAKERHFEIFPQLASFSHVRYVTTIPGYEHLAEAEKTTLGFRDSNNYCPSNPETYEVFFALMDELIYVFEPKYFHIGHDEATFDDIGTCPRCKDKAPADLFAGDVTKLHDYLAEKGITTLMWGDMFLPTHNGLKYDTVQSTDKVPKDIIICDWHYSPTHDNDASLQYFQDHGFRALGSPWYEPLNVWNWGRQVKEHGVLGYLGTTWSGVRNGFDRLPHMGMAWVVGAENCWSVEKPKIGEVTYQPVPTFNWLWKLGHEVTPRSFKLVDLAPFCNENTRDTERRMGWLGLGAEYDLRNLPTGNTWIGNTPFELVDPAKNAGKSCVMLADETTPEEVYPESVWEIPIGQKAQALRFLHTCSVPKKRVRALYDRNREKPTRIGWYIISYADGSEVKAELVYEASMDDWNSQKGPVQALDLWQGRTQAGAVATLAVWEWQNPSPDLEVASVSITSSVGAVKPVLLGITVLP